MARKETRFALLLGAASLLGAPSALAQVPAADGNVHEVRTGDTLWDLARQYLNDPFRWPEIYAVNRDVVRDPHWIYPRNRLLIPGRPGTVIPPLGVIPNVPERTVFFGVEPTEAVPGGIRMTPADQVAVVVPGSFHRAAVLVREEEFTSVGELVEVVSPTVLPRRGDPQIHPYDRVHMRLTGAVAEGDRLHLMRPSRMVQPYGRIFVATGSAVVLSVAGGVATVEVDRLYDLVGIGDLAVPFPEFVSRPGDIPIAATGLEGTLLAFTETQPVAATEDMGFVNLGTASGVVEGDEFLAFIPATVAEWGIRPETGVARLQVVRAGRVTSAVRVISLEQPALEPGLPVRLVGKMP